MSPTTEQAPAEAEAVQDEALRLGEIVVGTHNGAPVVRWTLGTAAVARGLTVAGIAAAATATGRYLASVTPQQITRSPQVVISVHTWSVPLVYGHATAVAALMREVVNAPGSIGQLA